MDLSALGRAGTRRVLLCRTAPDKKKKPHSFLCGLVQWNIRHPNFYREARYLLLPLPVKKRVQIARLHQ